MASIVLFICSILSQVSCYLCQQNAHVQLKLWSGLLAPLFDGFESLAELVCALCTGAECSCFSHKGGYSTTWGHKPSRAFRLCLLSQACPDAADHRAAVIRYHALPLCLHLLPDCMCCSVSLACICRSFSVSFWLSHNYMSCSVSLNCICCYVSLIGLCCCIA